MGIFGTFFLHECKKYYLRLSGWLLTAGTLLLGGILFWINNVGNNTSDFLTLFSGWLLFAFIAVPPTVILSLKKDFAEGRREILLSLPIRHFSLLGAKFLGFWVSFSAPMLAGGLLYLTVLSNHATLSFGSFFASLGGLLLSVGATVALSMLFAFAFRNSILAVSLAILLNLAMYFIQLITLLLTVSPWVLCGIVIAAALLAGVWIGFYQKKSRLSGYIAGVIIVVSALLCVFLPRIFDLYLLDVLYDLSVSTAFRNCCGGHFSWTGAIYLLFLTFTALFFATRIAFSDRIKKPSECRFAGAFLHTVMQNGQNRVALILAGSLLIPVLLTLFLPLSVSSVRTKKNETFEISDTSRELLHDLKEPITFYYLSAGGKRNADPDLYRFVQSYETLSDKITVKTVDSLTQSDTLSAFGDYMGYEDAILIVCGEKSQLLPADILFFYCFDNTEALAALLGTTDQTTLAQAYQYFCVNLFGSYSYYPTMKASDYKNSKDLLEEMVAKTPDYQLYLDVLNTCCTPYFQGDYYLTGFSIVLSDPESESLERLNDVNITLCRQSDLDSSPSMAIRLIAALFVPLAAAVCGGLILYARKKR